jgi:hypothetical protein
MRSLTKLAAGLEFVSE